MTAPDPALLAGLRAATAPTGRRVPTVLAEIEAVLDHRWPLLDALVPPAVEPGARSHILHAEPGFSVVALTVAPGAATPVHDHLTWCVVAVVRGREHETTYTADLAVAGEEVNEVGSITSLVPPGDIHRVRNDGDVPAVSVHVYGADLSRAGSSVRRTYALPVLAGR